MDGFDWDMMQSFLAVVRAGRLTLAARQLGIDHSTLSRRIIGLERTLRIQLFERSPSGYLLTPQGERLLESAQAMESVAMTVLSEVGDSRLRVAGTVRIGAPDGFGTVFLAPRLGQLATLHPDLVVQLITLPRVFSLSKREADVAISLARPEEGRLHARKLTDYELGLYASAAYLDAQGPILDQIDLKRHRFIGYIEDLIYVPELDYLPLISRDIRASFTSSNLLAQYNATLAGVGVCVLPCFMAEQDKRLRRILADEVSLKRAFWLVVHSDMRDLARVRVVSDFIADAVKTAHAMFLTDVSGRPVSLAPYDGLR